MRGRCITENVVYQANIFPIENIKDKKIYIRIGNKFYNDRHSFSNPSLRNQAALSR